MGGHPPSFRSALPHFVWRPYIEDLCVESLFGPGRLQCSGEHFPPDQEEGTLRPNGLLWKNAFKAQCGVTKNYSEASRRAVSGTAATRLSDRREVLTCCRRVTG